MFIVQQVLQQSNTFNYRRRVEKALQFGRNRLTGIIAIQMATPVPTDVSITKNRLYITSEWIN